MHLDTQLVIALTALVAVIVGPFVTIYVTRRQIRADVVSKNKQEWINKLRDNIAEFLTELKALRLIALGADSFKQINKTEKIQHLILLENKINLSINPNEKNHRKLIELLEKEVAYVGKQFQSEVERGIPFEKSLENEIIVISQTILKQVWEEVKKGR